MSTPEMEAAVRVAANRTLDLDDPEVVWEVHDGQVLVFAVEQSGPGEGVRHLIGEFVPGDLVFGHARSASTRIGVLAVGVDEASLQPLARAPAAGAGDVAGDVAAGVERWIGACWSRLTEGRRAPAGSVQLAAGQRATIGAGQGVAGAPDVTWVAWPSGNASLVGQSAGLVGPGTALPIARDGWLTAVDDLDVESVGATDFMASHDPLASIDELTSATLAVMAGDLDLARRHREELTERGRARSAAAARRSMIELAEVLPTARRAADQVPAADVRFAVFGAVAGALGLSVGADDPGTEAALAQEDGREAFSRLATANGCRLRQVELSGQWWRDDPGPVIAFTADGNAVALLPRVTGYEIFDPSSGQSVQANESTAGSLDAAALSVHRTLGSELRRSAELVRNGLARSGLDLGRVLLFGSFAGLASLVTPLLTGIVFNQVVPENERGRLAIVVVVLIVVALSVAMASLARGVAYLRIQGRFESTSQVSLWDRLLRLPVSFFNGFLVGDLTGRAMSVEIMQNVVAEASVVIVLNGVFSLFNLALFGAAGVGLLLVGLGLIVVEITFVVVASVIQVRLGRRQLVARNRTQGFSFQVIRGIYKLRVAAAESNAFAVWARLFAAQRRATYRVGRTMAVVAVFATVWSTLTTLAIIATLAGRGLHASIGSYIEFTTAFAQVSLALVSVVGAMGTVVQLFPLLDQVKPILASPVETAAEREDPGVLSGSVTVSQIVFRYHRDSPIVLDGVSLDAAPGEFVAIVGPSGAGKSSLVRLLLGFETPEAGSILFDRKDLSGLDPAAVRRQLGTMIQSARLLPGSVYSNIAGGHAISREEAWQAAEAAGVAEEIRAMPMGMETAVVEGSSTVSGGQRQRILIARSLALKPRILILDEAMSALDNVTQAVVTASLERLQITRIVIAHRLSTIQSADRIYVMVRGRIVQVGTFADLIAVPGVFSDLAVRQLV